jgi:glycosyltransferase involved in cell wall biosynthesis
VVLTALGSDVNVLLDDRRARAQIIAALHRADAITTKSAQLRSRIIAVGIRAELVTATVNGVDSGCFVIRDQDASARALGIPVAERRLLFVGKLARIKGLPSLLKAFASIAAEDRTLALYIVGDGCDRSQNEEIARERGIEDRVRFVGAQHPTRIPLWLGAADLLCLPSVDEGCPNVVLEALASGRPVVASAVGGVPDLVTSSSGLLVPAGDEAALAAALRCALRRQWDASTIRSHVLRRTWADAAEGYHAVYGRVIRARRPSAAASGARYSRLASHSG